jgi:hypothetical protein
VDGLTKTISQGSAALARFITSVSPTGLTSKKQVAEADNGDVITGREEDVHTLQSNKSADFATADNTNQQVMQRLARAFLVTSAVVRQAERVTAEEVHKVAQELEEVLGAVYSEQVVTFQTPYVGKKLRLLMKLGRVTSSRSNTVHSRSSAGPPPSAATRSSSPSTNTWAEPSRPRPAAGPPGDQPPRVYGPPSRRARDRDRGLIYTEEQAAQSSSGTRRCRRC